MSDYQYAVDRILGQLEDGYIDLGDSHFDDLEMSIIRDAMSQYVKTHDDNGNLINKEVM